MSPGPRDRALGKLIVLQRAREEAERAALARAADEVARVAAAERRAEEDGRRVEEALGLAERAPVAERAPAQLLQFESRFIRSLRRMAIATELQRAKVRGERITAEEAAARSRAVFERARRARERFEEQERRCRREALRTRERREEQERDDDPPRGG